MKKNADRKQNEFGESVNPEPDRVEFDGVVESALSRRRVLKGIIAFGSVAGLSPVLFGQEAKAQSSRFAFSPIATNTADDITLPEGYSSSVLVRWGDPLWEAGAEFDHETRGTAASQALAFGDNADGMELFSVGSKTVLVVNNEYTNRGIMWGNRADGKFASDDDVAKGKAAHGVSIVEVALTDGEWSIVKDSPLNRRVTPDTEMVITGPAAGNDAMKTNADPSGTVTLGTWNNCGNGSTPWGTYLACEENFNGYFSASDESFEPNDQMKRYGLKNKDRGYGWATIDSRFDLSMDPNEPNRCGYVTEIDPGDPNSKPKKRTALGRFKHENAELVVNADGHVVVYMGDDERGEFLYRYVSNGVFAPGASTDHLLEDGKLYAAKFNDDGTGKWLELNPETSGMKDRAEVCIFARIAGSAVGATTMDRPEWVAANPHAAEVYCALTNNKNRGLKTNAGGDETPVGGPNPREANKYGQIVRWRPDNHDHTSDGFAWDLFVLAGNPAVHSDDRAGSQNVTPDNMFNSPDGIKFDSHGVLWIQTDGNYSNEKDFAGQGNNQMLAADPATGEIKRFMVGPKQCEVTGLTWSPDRRTMFVGIQHPGERGEGNWPEGNDAVPRSAVITIRRDDGGLMG